MATVIRSRKTFLLFAIICVFQVKASRFYTDEKNVYQKQAELLQQHISRFAEIQKNGGWQKLVLNKKQYVKGESAPFIKLVKQRLQVSGEHDEKDTSQVFTAELQEAIKKVQHQFGFKENGVIDALLVSALNIPVHTRIQQLQVNLDRARTLSVPSYGRQLVVNIPEYKLHVYENGSHVFDMNVVVGSEKNQTAIFNDELTHIVFSPYWNVPQSIVQNEILPAMRRNRRYLSANGYERVGTENGLPKIRQKPGNGNSLGLVKFLFPNEHDIYFHDSPAKSLFSHRIRAYSHGCVRLAEPAKLAAYLLKDDPEWTPGKIEAAMNAGKEEWVKLSVTVPVSIVYLTAWVDHNGVLNFRDDVYEMDNTNAVAGLGQ